MDAERARTLLQAERTRVEQLLAELTAQDDALRGGGNGDQGDAGDGADRLTTDATRELVAASLRARLDAVERAEGRLADGTYGRSLRSGLPIPDERLEVDPTAEALVDEPAEAAAR
jgi:DnaK suppressor protein